VFGEEFNRGAVANRISLGQVLHGFHQSSLAVHVAWIRGSFSSLATYAGKDWNRKNFGHEELTTAYDKQYICACLNFQP
jgi:hypothetical protein